MARPPRPSKPITQAVPALVSHSSDATGRIQRLALRPLAPRALVIEDMHPWQQGVRDAGPGKI